MFLRMVCRRHRDKGGGNCIWPLDESISRKMLEPLQVRLETLYNVICGRQLHKYVNLVKIPGKVRHLGCCQATQAQPVLDRVQSSIS